MRCNPCSGRSKTTARALAAVTLAFAFAPDARAATFLTTLRTAFDTAQPGKVDYALNAANIVKATQLSGVSLTTDYTFLGFALDYPAAKTGLPFDFQLSSLTPYRLHYRKLFAAPFGPEGLSAGNVDPSTANDFEIRFTGGKAVKAFGFNHLDNEGGPDTLHVFNAAGVQIATLAVPTGKEQFLAVTSDEPISRVVFDDGGNDYSGFNGLTFGFVPEPGAAAMAIFPGCAALMRRVRRRASNRT
jgi:hypothetical protein